MVLVGAVISVRVVIRERADRLERAACDERTVVLARATEDVGAVRRERERAGLHERNREPKSEPVDLSVPK